jgi:DNA helicase-2/ATP-dependent DNA helicase PcrA
MQKRGLYDFDDMIFLVARTIEKNTSLRNELEEKYQYIMIDEFQDTNDAQMSLVTLLTSSPINEGRPNVLAVGDDDQAIYKFQGAELSNLYRFRHAYTDVQMIVLDKNYRSTQEILDFARSVITKAIDRLETRFPNEINKKIVSSNTKLKSGNIIQKSFDNIHSEMDFVATEIKKLLSQGVDPKEISVISKSHENLKKLSLIMNTYQLPYSYEKREHVLEKQPIHELVTITKFAASGSTDESEAMLPEILSYKFFNLSRIDIWKIAESVRNGTTTVGELGERIYKKKNWLEAMLAGDTKTKRVAEFLIELLADAKSLPLANLLDKIIGTHEYEVDTQIDDIELTKNENEIHEKGKYGSPFREYYFGKDNFEHNKPEYLDFLFSLRTFIGALREYKQGQMLHAADIFEFVNVYSNNDKLTLMSVSPFATSEQAVVLQTAHKSKGLEYEYVFIINSDENEWNGRGYSNKIGMPTHLKLLPDADNTDDKIRLYYVAMTRTKHTLCITHHKNKLGFILSDTVAEVEKSEINKHITDSLYITEKKEYLDDEKVLLKRLLENYKMPVTHMINFLNIGKVGPEKFIEQNLLRFPQAMSPSSVYGSAMHEAMQNYYLYYKKHEKVPELEQLKSYFENALSRGSLSVVDHNKYLKSGYENLSIYISDLENRGVRALDMVEVNFAHEGVLIGEVQATGKIDKMEIDGQNIKVTDLKTGKAFSNWEDTDTEYDKIKMHFFTYQLAYYYLLIKNSRTYSNYNVEYGYIEFLEADKGGNIHILELKLDDALVSRASKLANVIYKKILSLDFPDTSHYTKNDDGTDRDVKLKDIVAFEDDLLSGAI